VTLDSVDVAVLTDDVSDNYVSKTRFAVSEFANVVLRGASVISGEALLCANLGFGLRLVSNAGGQRHTMLFDTGPEAAIFIRNCTALGVGFGEIEAIAITHGHWDHMAALPATIDRIIQQGGRVTPRQSRNVQRARHPAEQRENRPGGERSAPVRVGPARCDSRQQRGGPSAPGRPLLLQRGNSSGQRVREGPRRPLLSKEPRGALAARPLAAGRAPARGEGAW